MASGAKIRRGPAPDAGSSTKQGTWGFEAEELPELQGTEEPDDIREVSKEGFKGP